MTGSIRCPRVGEGIVQVDQEVLEGILRVSRKWESHDFHLLFGSIPHIYGHNPCKEL